MFFPPISFIDLISVRGTHVSLALNACDVCGACVGGSASVAFDLIAVPIGRVVYDACGVQIGCAACVARDTCGVHVAVAGSKGWLV